MPAEKGDESAKKRKARKDAGKRVVFASQDGSEAGYDVIGVYEGNGPQAKKAALRANEELRARVNAGGVKLAAVPAAGWDPKEPIPPDPEAFKGL